MSRHGGAIRKKRRADMKKADKNPGFSKSFQRKINKVNKFQRMR